MPTKIVVELKGNMYDLWELRTFEKEEQYNEQANNGEGAMEYLIVINRKGIATNANEIMLPYDTKEERDADMKKVKDAFIEFEGSILIT